MADPIIGYDKGAKFAFGVALGADYRFKNKWSAFIESRGVSWSQDNRADTIIFSLEGELVTISSSEFTIGAGYAF